ncbi:jg25254 [Pararge aegeria aegeria]|uniref:Jg25254 protein n=1 Tax=Pararge aegeria aegeria TaxID=348720 RepID=A0A8S4S6P2_9NEOP|nr:jg25254 [Pararge aegeria aegeria]
MEKIEHRAVIKFLTKQGKSVQTILEEMSSVYGESCPGKTMVYKWHTLFKQGRASLEDDPRPGRPIEVTTPEIIQKVEKLILEDARLKKKQLAEMVGVSDTTIFKILHDHLGMTKVSARWVPRMLTPPQKQQRVECSRAFLDLCNEDQDGVLTRIVTGDETWVHHYEPESKQDSMQWHKKGTPPPKKFKVSQSAGKIMATIFWDSILLIDYKDKGVSITGEYYASILERLKEAIKAKRRGKLTKGVLLLHDNAPVHKSRVALASLYKMGFDILVHPPYSPDLAPSDYYLFPKMKKELRGKKFSSDEEVKEAVSAYFSDRKNIFFRGYT